jgi:hypothetical protein
MLMIIWTGRGFWAALFPVLFVGVLGAVVNYAFGEPALDANDWVYGVALVAAAIAVWFYGCRWNGRTSLKPWEFRAMLRRRGRHRMFALPMEFWALPLAILGVWVIASNLPGKL